MRLSPDRLVMLPPAHAVKAMIDSTGHPLPPPLKISGLQSFVGGSGFLHPVFLSRYCFRRPPVTASPCTSHATSAGWCFKPCAPNLVRSSPSAGRQSPPRPCGSHDLNGVLHVRLLASTFRAVAGSAARLSPPLPAPDAKQRFSDYDAEVFTTLVLYIFHGHRND